MNQTYSCVAFKYLFIVLPAQLYINVCIKVKVLQTKYDVKMSRLICNHICPLFLRKDVKIMCFQSNLMNFYAVGWHMLRHSFLFAITFPYQYVHVKNSNETQYMYR